MLVPKRNIKLLEDAKQVKGVSNEVLRCEGGDVDSWNKTRANALLPRYLDLTVPTT